MKTYKRNGKYIFDTIEIREMERNLPDMLQERAGIDRRIALLKDDMKKLKSQFDAMDANATNLSKKIKDGFESRIQDCHRTRDWQNKQWIFTAIDSGLELCREPFTTEDMQMDIDDDGPNEYELESRRLARELHNKMGEQGITISTRITTEDEPADQSATEDDITPNEEE